MILTAERVSARSAESHGLINSVVRDDQLLVEAFNLARRIAEYSPLAVSMALSSVTRGLNVSIDEGLAIEASYFARMAATSDMREGIGAWLDGHPPQFTGT